MQVAWRRRRGNGLQYRQPVGASHRRHNRVQQRGGAGWITHHSKVQPCVGERRRRPGRSHNDGGRQRVHNHRKLPPRPIPGKVPPVKRHGVQTVGQRRQHDREPWRRRRVGRRVAVLQHRREQHPRQRFEGQHRHCNVGRRRHVVGANDTTGLQHSVVVQHVDDRGNGVHRPRRLHFVVKSQRVVGGVVRSQHHRVPGFARRCLKPQRRRVRPPAPQRRRRPLVPTRRAHIVARHLQPQRRVGGERGGRPHDGQHRRLRVHAPRQRRHVADVAGGVFCHGVQHVHAVRQAGQQHGPV